MTLPLDFDRLVTLRHRGLCFFELEEVATERVHGITVSNLTGDKLAKLREWAASGEVLHLVLRTDDNLVFTETRLTKT